MRRTSPPSIRPAPITGVSPNTETARRHLSKLPEQKLAFILDCPTLQSLATTHLVKVQEAGGKVQRQACMKLELSETASKKLDAYAEANELEYGALPSTKIARVRAQRPLVPLDVDLKLNDRCEMTAEPQYVSREKMNFPGTNTTMYARVTEMYVVRDKEESNWKAIARFFSDVFKPGGGRPGAKPDVKLGKPKHLGTVAGFELGKRYLLFRHLDKKQSVFDKLKKKFGWQRNDEAPKRKLLIEAHGEEQLHDGEIEPGVAHEFELPEGLAISHSAPSGKTVSAIGGFLKHGAGIKDIADLRARWPVYCVQRMSEGTHTLLFPGKDIAPWGPDIGYGRVDNSDLFQLGAGLNPTTGHGKTKNQLLGPSEDIRPENLYDGSNERPENNSRQRGVFTSGGHAFAALNPDKETPVDVLRVKRGKTGHVQDIIATLKRKGILDQYDEIFVSTCRADSRLDALEMILGGVTPKLDITGREINWPAEKRNLPRKEMPTIVEFEQGDAPRVKQVHIDHALEQMRSKALSATTMIAISSQENLD